MSRGTLDRIFTATEENELGNGVFSVAPGVWRLKDIFVNVFILQNQEANRWVLIDAGLKSSYSKIKKMINEVYGSDIKPSAIIMTHGHFDHRGSLQRLAEEWEVPVYCHHMEIPYLTGRASYPPPDSTVGGGMMSSLAFAYPTDPIDVSDYLLELPEDGSVPELNEWRWIHTPGHSPGHVSLFRERDKVLVAGDAVVTTQQESAFSVLTQKEIISGPPKYFTPDWGSAARSVKELAALEPEVIASGHGHTLYGEEAKQGLIRLSRKFWQLGMPKRGRYLGEAALFNEDGPTYVPPKKNNYMWLRIVGAVAMVTIGYWLHKKRHNKVLGKTLMTGSLTMLTAPVPKI